MKTTKTIEQALKEGNSSVNQRIKDKFISIHVHANVNSMVGYILDNAYNGESGPFNYESIENFYYYPEYKGQFANLEESEDLNEEIERLKDLINDDNEGTINEEIEALENLELQQHDVLEWWIVSNFLAEKLSDLNECVIDSESIWGRTTSGQAIALDYVITEICANMEILNGQANSWA